MGAQRQAQVRKLVMNAAARISEKIRAGGFL
jgi:hypothetical protein